VSKRSKRKRRRRALEMHPAERARLDRERRAWRQRVDDAANRPQQPAAKAEKHLKRERTLGRVSPGFDWDEVLERYGHQCAFCSTEGILTVDHIIPISRGGGNWAWNIRPLCELCNFTKGSQLDAEFELGRNPRNR